MNLRLIGLATAVVFTALLPFAASAAAGDAMARTAERCGPEVASLEGIEAQTCVLTAGA